MKGKFQPVNHSKDDYNRPQDKWVCGHLKDGHTCLLGPDKKGNCRATGECVPHKKGDRWSCTRSGSRGGKCKEGPLPDGTCCKSTKPCQPVRSLRSMRGMFTYFLLMVIVSVSIVFLGGSNRK